MREPPTDVFLLPHPDDEFAVFGALRDGRRAGHGVRCLFLTTGAAAGQTDLAETRKAESERVLACLGVAAEEIDWIGLRLVLADGSLVDGLDRAAAAVLEGLSGVSGAIRLFGPAWEGGHHDHDAAHLLTRRLAAALGLGGDAVRYFALYNSDGLPGPLFRILTPIAANGPVSHRPIAWQDRLEDLRLCLTYRSQWRSWIGLYPMLVLHRLFDGRQKLQRADGEIPLARPHPGRLRYERSYGVTFDAFMSRAVTERRQELEIR